MSAWSTLHIDPTSDLIAIKRAYAARLKVTRPDEDAAAYQALRHAYEFAQQHARWAAAEPVMQTIEPDTDQKTPLSLPKTAFEEDQAGEAATASLAKQEPTSPDAAGQSAPSHIPPHALAEQTLHYLRSAGGDALVASWPRLKRELDNLPLGERPEASKWFAQLVIDAEQMPRSYAHFLSEYFHWDTDFRTEQALGIPLAIALRERLHEIDYGFQADAAFRQRYAEVAFFGQLVGQLSRSRLYLFAIFATSRLARLWNELAPRQRYALGVPLPPQHSLADHAMEMGGWVRTAIVMLLAASVSQVKNDGDASWLERLAYAALAGGGGLLVLHYSYHLMFLRAKRSLHAIMRPEGLAPGLPSPSLLAALGFSAMVIATVMCGLGEADAWPAAFQTSFARPMVACIPLLLIVAAALTPSLPTTEAQDSMPVILAFCVVTGIYLPGFASLPWTGACAGMTWFMGNCIAHTLYGDAIENRLQLRKEEAKRQRANIITPIEMLLMLLSVLRVTLGWPYRLMLLATNMSARYVIAIVSISLVALPTGHRAWQLPLSIGIVGLFTLISNFYYVYAVQAMVPGQKAKWRGWANIVFMTLWLAWIGLYFSIGPSVDALVGLRPAIDETDTQYRRFGFALVAPLLLIFWSMGLFNRIKKEKR